MTCRELSDRLLEHFDRELNPQVEALLLAHADSCSCCRHLVSTYGLTIELGRGLETMVIPAPVADALDALLGTLVSTD